MRRRNYIRVANKHIFLNFTDKNIIDLEDIEGKERQQKIHVIITTHHAIDENLYHLIQAFSDNTQITIHVPHQVKDLKVVIDDFLSKFKKKWKIFVERKGPVFRANDNTTLRVLYLDNGVQTLLSFGAAEYTGYKFVKMKIGGDGAITSTPMLLHPELFKQQIIDSFKKICAKEILEAAFDTDDKIWEYVMGLGEWNIKQEE